MINTTYAPLSVKKIGILDSSTVGIVELAKALLVDKEYLPKAEFNRMVQSFGWGRGLVQNYLKIAQAFADVEINKLMRIEPRTLFKITSSKKFVSVVEGIKNAVGHVTQQFVENLINACKTPLNTRPDKPTIWRSEKDGSRSCVVPPIKEDDQFTGMSIQRAMDIEGMTPQSFVREAAAFREAWSYGAFLLVGDLPPHLQEILGDKLEYAPPTDAYHEQVQVETDHDYTETTVEVEETTEVFESTASKEQTVELPQIEEVATRDIETTVADVSESEQQRIKCMKQATQPTIKVGDKVNWANHYPHLSSWLPLEVQEIKDGKVKLELCDFLVPIEELSINR